MTNFELKPGDYIHPSDVPENKRQAVRDAFAAAGADKPGSWEPYAEDLDFFDFCEFLHELDYFVGDEVGVRRVTLEQVLGEAGNED